MPFGRRRKVNVEIRNYEDEMPRVSWARRHPAATIVLVSVLIVSLVVGGFVYFVRRNNPVSRFVTAASRTVDAGFAFDARAEYNGDEVLRYTGAMTVDAPAQSMRVSLDASVTDYTYRNVVYTDSRTSYLGNYYNGQWTVSDCSSRVLDFFDFYSDFRNHNFDAGAFLRFTDKTSDYNAAELKRMIDRLTGKLSSSNEISNLKITQEDGLTRYIYTPDIAALSEYVYTSGGPMFFSAEAYEQYRAKYLVNEETLEDARLRFWFAITDDGYLGEVGFEVVSGDLSHKLEITMSDFGAAQPEIGEDFYSAASLAAPAE